MQGNTSLRGLDAVRGLVLIVSLLGIALTGIPCSAANLDDGVRMRVSETYGNLPLQFEANRGQTDDQVKFLWRGPARSLFLTASEAVLVSTNRAPHTPRATSGIRRTAAADGPAIPDVPAQSVLRIAYVGANPAPRIVGSQELPGKANYFLGNDPAKWRTNVPTYARVHYQDLYPGIDLVYYGTQRQVEYDFVVRPGADPNRIVLGFQGADRLEVDAEGDLVLQTRGGVVRQRRPRIYQEVDGVRTEIRGDYVKVPGTHWVSFRVATYDASRPLVIDPVLVYSTFLGGSLDDVGQGIAVDAAGNAYVTGVTRSADFPTTPGAFDTSFNNVPPSGNLNDVTRDAFVTKLNATGTALVYSTFLGGSRDFGGGGSGQAGSGEDEGLGIAVDAAGNAYVTGLTESRDFPTTPGAFDTTDNGFRDAFVTKLNATGTALVYSTFLGGSDGEEGRGIAVDTAGSAYVTGVTASADFPTTPGAFATTLNGGSDAFVTKLNAAGTALVYSTFLGGSGSEGVIGFIAQSGGIAVDAAGNAYVTGTTPSADFPTTPGAFDTTFNGLLDAFVTKLNAAGSALVYSTFLGGSSQEDGVGIAVDAAGNAYVTGNTASVDFPTTPGAFDTTFNGGSDAFVTKLNAAGTALVYSTFLGGSGAEGVLGGSIAVDSAGNAYVTGFTSSADFPTTPGAFGTTLNGAGDAFVTKLDATGTALVYSIFLGGSGLEEGGAIALDPAGNAYVTGLTSSADFPTTPGAFDTTYNGAVDAFVTKLAENPTTEAQCKNGGFQQFGFKNQGQCIRFIETGKDSRIGQ
jgi:hypothetical protein